ncbi:MAG: hypothetical protein ACYDAY_09570 [Candidatus Dormibacteria bacterium]
MIQETVDIAQTVAWKGLVLGLGAADLALSTALNPVKPVSSFSKTLEKRGTRLARRLEKDANRVIRELRAAVGSEQAPTSRRATFGIVKPATKPVRRARKATARRATTRATRKPRGATPTLVESTGSQGAIAS